MSSSLVPKTIFHPSQLQLLDPSKIPAHVTVIPDGNRRWAKREGATIYTGHQQGGENLIEIVKAAREIGIKAISFYLFSTENWNRQSSEVEALMCLLEHILTSKRQEMLEYGIRVHSIGDLTPLPKHSYQAVLTTKEATAHCQDIDMIMALNYGGRDEICRAARAITADCLAGKIQLEEIDPQRFASYLDSAPWKDPELFIRTGGEMRLSNYLLWQLSYSEIYICERFWPDFGPQDLLTAITTFQQRERRLGGM